MIPKLNSGITSFDSKSPALLPARLGRQSFPRNFLVKFKTIARRHAKKRTPAAANGKDAASFR
jgi:hypothetical protein